AREVRLRLPQQRLPQLPGDLVGGAALPAVRRDGAEIPAAPPVRLRPPGGAPQLADQGAIAEELARRHHLHDAHRIDVALVRPEGVDRPGQLRVEPAAYTGDVEGVQTRQVV